MMAEKKEPGSQLVVDYYTSSYSEAERLGHSHNRLEYVRTCELLETHLPAAPAKILDVGGGPGVYAAWLAARSYEVELLDLVEAHVRQAKELSATLESPFTARVGDARSLDVEDESQDVRLLLGPLYHLPEPADRRAALSEAIRVTRRGGLIVAAAISRYSWPLDDLRKGLITPERAKFMEKIATTGKYDPAYGFTTAYAHLPRELKQELEDAGLADVWVTGIEGPGWLLFKPELSDEEVETFLTRATLIARLCDGDMNIAAASSHLLAHGRKP